MNPKIPARPARHPAGWAGIPPEPALARPAGHPAGRVCLRPPGQTRRRLAFGFVLELIADLVQQVGTGLAELVANAFPTPFNLKFNEMRGPADQKVGIGGH